MEQNNEKKPSKAKSIWLSFANYIKYIFVDFFTSFKYNKMKLPGFLVAIPGIFLGFFLTFHIPVVNSYSFISAGYVDGVYTEMEYFPDISALILFVLVLFGILNLFTAFNMMSKKNLGSVVTSTITTVVIVAAGAIYLYMLFLYVGLRADEIIKVKDDYGNLIPFTWSTNYVASLISVIFSMVSSVVGVVLGFIFYDRNYKKVKF